MSRAKEKRKAERPIVIHAPLTGDPERVAQISRAIPKVRATDVVGPMTPTPKTAAAPVTSVAPGQRVMGLDAFRGLLLLAMNFTFTIPTWGPFPKWMYHTQEPPAQTPIHVNVAGLTWQDFLFAMFVFAMAAAIPIATNGRLAKGKPYSDVIWGAVKRAFTLWLFALVIGHVNPYWTHDYTKRGNVLSLLGFVVAFAYFLQPPAHWKPSVQRAVKTAGLVGVIALLFGVPLIYGDTFSAVRRDGIMAALAFCALAGTLVWLFTRANVLARIAIFAFVAAARAVAPLVPAFGQVWNANPAPWFYEPWYMELLLIVIPGTIAGDLIWRWMHRGAPSESEPGWARGRQVALAALGLSVPVILCVGLYERRYPLGTTIATIGVSVALVGLTRAARSAGDRILGQLFAWGALWLTLGVLVEPFEGGIKKDPQTLGFLLLMAGASTVMLGALLLAFDSLKAGARRLRPLALIGQNALFAYVVLMLCGLHLLWLTGIGEAMTSTWQQATLRSVLLTFVAGLAVWFATRKRLIWKA